MHHKYMHGCRNDLFRNDLDPNKLPSSCIPSVPVVILEITETGSKRCLGVRGPKYPNSTSEFMIRNGSDDLLKSPEIPKSPLKSPKSSPKSPLNVLKSGLMVYIIPQFIIVSYVSITVCMIL